MPGDLHIQTDEHVIAVPADRPFVIGRASSSDMRVRDPRVSRRHLLIESTPAGWQAVDLSSANGSWADGQRFARIVLDGPVQLSLGALDGPRLTLVPANGAGGEPRPVIRRPATPTPMPPAAAPTPDEPPPPEPSRAIPHQQGPTASSPPQAPPVAAIPQQPVTAPLDAAPPTPVDAGDGESPPGQGEETILADSERGSSGPQLPAGAEARAVSGPTGRVFQTQLGRMTIGRARTNDVVVGDLLVSREHAELFVGTSGMEIVDLGSANGTFVNGQKVERAVLRAGDAIAVGHHVFQVVGDTLVEYLDAGDVTFEVDGLSVYAGTTQILHDVTFRLPERALLAVIGPSGSGKSTLLGALTGFRPAGVGTVRYSGRDLYAQYAELRHRLGYVPQDDILHTSLTVRQALEFGARLRFPADTTADERSARIDTVLAELGLTGADEADLGMLLGEPAPAAAPAAPGAAGGRPLVDRQISTLSGGQRKRVSVALELLTEPTLLFLDEPTSGLDPGLDLEVMESLRALADGGRTVVVVTHSVAQLDLCDAVLVLAKGGHVAYVGPPQEALPFLKASSWSQAFRLLRSERGADVLSRRYRESRYFVDGSPRVTSPNQKPAPLASRRQQSVFSQLLTLSRRYLRVIASDRSYLRLLIAYPFVLGLIPRVISPSQKLTATASGEPNRTASLVLLVLILCGIFLGMSSAIREIVKEREIYRRERGIGLSMFAYLGSKIGILTLIIAAQSIVFTVVGVAGRTPSTGVVTPFPLLELTIAVGMTAVASAMIGLLISALVDNADKTMPLLVVLTMAQLVFTGAFMPIAHKIGLEEVAALSPARFGYAAACSVVDIEQVQHLGDPRLNPGSVTDPLWRHAESAFLTDLGGIAALGLISIVATALLLRRLDPRVGRRRRA